MVPYCVLILIVISQQILRVTIEFVFTEPFSAKLLQLENLAQTRLHFATHISFYPGMSSTLEFQTFCGDDGVLSGGTAFNFDAMALELVAQSCLCDNRSGYPIWCFFRSCRTVQDVAATEAATEVALLRMG